MNYQEKLKLADKGVEILLKGQSIEFYKTKLQEEGYSRFDIDKVIRTIKNQIFEKYDSKFKYLLIENILEENRYKFSNLNDDIFEYIRKREIESIKDEIKNNIKELIHNTKNRKVKYSDVDCLSKEKFLSKTEIENYIANYYDKNKYLNPRVRIFNLIIGTALILVAIMNFVLSKGNPFSFLFPLILGVISLKSYFKH